MVKRSFWISEIEKLWKKRSLIWLSGVRRAGKTMLCQSLDTIEYFDCELPRIRERMEDPEAFWNSMHGKRIVLDEVHRLQNPSEVLKIATDHFPGIKVIATGSSSLSATAKFKDTLTGRKSTLHLTPMIYQDLVDFNAPDLSHRFLNGGLPPFFLTATPEEREFQEWLDAFWSKDILELFRLERRHSFLKFAEMLFTQSGSMFEASRFAGPCEVSRTTIANYLSVLASTYVVTIVRPYSSYKTAEIVAAPKVFAFDTGFVSYYKGWQKLRTEDMGHLWEQFVLNELLGALQTPDIHYWRDKAGHEIDFVITSHSGKVDTIECKWSHRAFGPENLVSFRKRHPTGRNYVVSADLTESYAARTGDIPVEYVTLHDLLVKMQHQS
jgi:Predicted ATPase (AAA+ superfamily)